jgi:hypothetical protein
MSEYNRTTRECSLSQLQPELLQAIQDYFLEHRLGSLEAEALMCCETISSKKSTSKLVSWLSGSTDDTIHTGMLLTSEWLIWVHHGDRSGIRLNAANLKLIRASYATYAFTKDVGLEVIGLIGDAKDPVRGQIAMGSDLAAQRFCEEVKQAITRANPPSPKRKRRWFGI